MQLRSRKGAGFSLIELLVALLILALLTGVVSLSLGTGTRDASGLVGVAASLTDSLHLAQEDAVLANAYRGLRLQATDSGTQLHWLAYREGSWQELDNLLPTQVLPDSINVSLRVDGEALAWQTALDDAAPMLFLDPTGDAGSFELQLAAVGGGPSYTLFTDARGAITARWQD